MANAQARADILLLSDEVRGCPGKPPDPRYDEYFRYLYLQHVPESIAPLAASIADRSQLTRPAFPEAQAGALPAWMQRLPELPTVYVTLTLIRGLFAGFWQNRARHFPTQV